MNSYQVRSTNPSYGIVNYVLAHIIAESMQRANSLAVINDLDMNDPFVEIIVERRNIVDQLGKPYPESITIY